MIWLCWLCPWRPGQPEDGVVMEVGWNVGCWYQEPVSLTVATARDDDGEVRAGN